MSPDPSNNPPAKPADPAPGHASGKGADTALEALIRQRKRAELPDEHQAQPPEAPAHEAR